MHNDRNKTSLSKIYPRTKNHEVKQVYINGHMKQVLNKKHNFGRDDYESGNRKKNSSVR